jgi:hypothetical protein
MPPASAGTATSEADQNRIAPVPGKPERLGADGHGHSADGTIVSELVTLAGLFAKGVANPGPQRASEFSELRDWPVKPIPPRRSGRTGLVTTSAGVVGGVVTRLCAFIPNPVRPGDPPGRLLSNLYCQTSFTPASASRCGKATPAMLNLQTGSFARSSPCPAPET